MQFLEPVALGGVADVFEEEAVALYGDLPVVILVGDVGQSRAETERGELLELMRTGGLKAFLEARDGSFRPEPFGPRAERPRE